MRLRIHVSGGCWLCVVLCTYGGASLILHCIGLDDVDDDDDDVYNVVVVTWHT